MSPNTLPEQQMRWNIPTPANYFQGLNNSNLALADNILFFHRTSRDFLNIRNFESRPHHRFVLIFNYKTTGNINVDGDTYHFKPGQAFLIAPLQFHFYLDIPTEYISWIYMTFVCKRPECFAPLSNTPINLNEENYRVLATILDQYEGLSNATEHNSKIEYQTNIWMLQCNRLLQQLLGQATETMTSDVPTQNTLPNLSDPMIQKINQFLDDDSFHHADLAAIAESLHISPSHLRRKFRKLTGISLGNYQIHYRMNLAIKYLTNTDATLTDIAELCGYESLSAFSRSFKSRFGKSPSQYRNSES